MDISVKNLNKSFDNKEVLKNVSYAFKKGERYCIVGFSGCGKTTLLKILMGLLPGDAGEILGLENQKISAVFQEDRLCENLTVRKNITMVGRTGIPPLLLSETLKIFGLPGYENERVKNLSGGMKRRVAIARAALQESDILIMDEPFKGLDTEIKNQVIASLDNLTRGKTVIWVTHVMEEVDFFRSTIVQL